MSTRPHSTSQVPQALRKHITEKNQCVGCILIPKYGRGCGGRGRGGGERQASKKAAQAKAHGPCKLPCRLDFQPLFREMSQHSLPKSRLDA